MSPGREPSPNSIQFDEATSNKWDVRSKEYLRYSKYRRRFSAVAHRAQPARQLLFLFFRENTFMSLVRLLGYTTLACGCVVGRYREVASSRELAYVEEKGLSCGSHGHRRNHTVAAERVATVSSIAVAKAS